MKKFISIISIILTFTMLFCSTAYAKDAWETSEVDLSGDSSTWETEEIPFDNEKISVSKCTITNIKSKTYTGKVIHQTPTVKYNKKTLKKGTDYTLSYAKNIKVGTATVTIKGKGYFNGSVKKTFRINPKSTTISKLSKPKTKQIKITWKKQKTQTTGYQIQIATNSSFTKSKKLYTSTKNTYSALIIKNLKKNKTYYVRIRTYKTVSGKKYYSSWSKAKYIKTK